MSAQKLLLRAEVAVLQALVETLSKERQHHRVQLRLETTELLDLVECGDSMLTTVQELKLAQFQFS